MEELRFELEKALKYCLSNADKYELQDHFDWYEAEDLTDLFYKMYESYLNNYDEKELKDRIEDLYK
jgi:hypothetical protein